MDTAARHRKVRLIVSRGGLDEVHPAMIIANAARMSGIETMIFFTVDGLDCVTEAKVDHLHVHIVGNQSRLVPTMLDGLPGMESFAAKLMKSKMDKLDMPPARKVVAMLEVSGAELYGCQLAMETFELGRKDLLPQVKDIISAGDFFALSEGAQVIFT